jgi:hypothetical protein
MDPSQRAQYCWHLAGARLALEIDHLDGGVLGLMALLLRLELLSLSLGLALLPQCGLLLCVHLDQRGLHLWRVGLEGEEEKQMHV